MAPSHWNNFLDAFAVSTQIASPNWAFRTNPDNWEDRELMDLLGQEVGAPLDDINTSLDRVPLMPSPEFIDPHRTSMGNLSRLSEHLLTGSIVPLMDYASIYNLSLTCYRARAVLSQNEILPILFRHCSKVFPALYALRLHDRVSIKDLILELQYGKCRSCGENGTHLFLPTVERVCSNCLRHNRAFWPISLHDAKQCFGLEHQDFRVMPAFRNTRAELAVDHLAWYGFPPDIVPKYLVAVKSALTHALKVHGSVETLAGLQSADLNRDSSTQDIVNVHFYRYLRRALLGTLPCDPTQAPAQPTHESVIAESCSERIYLGTASISFPYVPRGEERAEKRYKCIGCEWVIDHFAVCPDHLEYMGIAPNAPAHMYTGIMVGRTFISYNRDELREHWRSCLGAGLRMWRRWVLSEHPDGLGSDI